MPDAHQIAAMATGTPITTKLAATVLASLALTACSATPQATPQATHPGAAVFAPPSQWQALSTTAMSITGDITLSDKRLTFTNGDFIDLKLLEHNQQTGQTLFRVTTRTNPELLNGNRICGSAPVDYIVAQVSGDVPGQSDLQLMAYYYPEELRLNDLPLKDPNDIKRMMCALYTYVSPAE